MPLLVRNSLLCHLNRFNTFCYCKFLLILPKVERESQDLVTSSCINPRGSPEDSTSHALLLSLRGYGKMEQELILSCAHFFCTSAQKLVGLYLRLPRNPPGTGLCTATRYPCNSSGKGITTGLSSLKRKQKHSNSTIVPGSGVAMHHGEHLSLHPSRHNFHHLHNLTRVSHC